jgi:hypothetical protein
MVLFAVPTWPTNCNRIFPLNYQIEYGQEWNVKFLQLFYVVFHGRYVCVHSILSQLQSNTELNSSKLRTCGTIIIGWELDWCVFSATFNNISVVSWQRVNHIGGGNESITWRKPFTCCKYLAYEMKSEKLRNCLLYVQKCTLSCFQWRLL